MGATDRPLGAFALGKYPLGFRKAGTVRHEPYSFPPGSYTFTPTLAGYWRFAGWGPGFSNSASAVGGDAGAYAEITRFLTPAQSVTVVVGKPGTNTTFTFPDGKVVTAGAATGAAGAGPGVATGGDVNLTGGSGSGSGNPGGNAPTSGNYRGGTGGTSAAGDAPGGGAGIGTASGGSGLALVSFVKP